ERILELVDHTTSQGQGILGPRKIDLEDGELVAAEPRDEIAAAYAGLQAVGHQFEQPVAGGMAKSVIDALEAIEVEEMQRKDVVAFRGTADLFVDTFRQQRPVGQSRQRIMVGDVVKMRLRPLVFSDVERGRQDVDDLALIVLERDLAR